MTIVHAASRTNQLARYLEIRITTERLCRPLAVEDYVLQSMPDASPTKWHLAHTTWFFETFVLRRTCPATGRSTAQFGYLFNSYYDGGRRPLAAAGPRAPVAADGRRGVRLPRARSMSGCVCSLGAADTSGRGRWPRSSSSG